MDKITDSMITEKMKQIQDQEKFIQYFKIRNNAKNLSAKFIQSVLAQHIGIYLDNFSISIEEVNKDANSLS